ncbi:hypothetical protein ACFSTC_13385 [Nonomuraea ferruginea]
MAPASPGPAPARAPPEAFAAELDGPEGERLTHWGSPSTQVRGWSADGQVHVVSAAGQGGRTRTWAHAVPLDGGPATRLPYGWVSEVAVSGDRVVTVSPMWREPSQWKRYRGGTAGKIWIDAEGSGEFTRLFADNPAQHWAAMWIGDRIAFLADTDGIGNLYSTLPDGSDPRRHTGHEEFYARHATTDGERIVYSHAERPVAAGEPRRRTVPARHQARRAAPGPRQAAGARPRRRVLPGRDRPRQRGRDPRHRPLGDPPRRPRRHAPRRAGRPGTAAARARLGRRRPLGVRRHRRGRPGDRHPRR